ncbi:MAG: DUF4298 domain-containing protein [Clostridiales bacterium]|nr:DUF4298 domain-containing protein [Clostridiales bacterium]
MDDNSKIQEIAKRGEAMQTLYEDVVRNNAQLKALMKQLKTMNDQLNELTAYYQGEWIRDRELLKNHPVRDYLIFAEDPIYDEIQDWDRQLDKLARQAGRLLEEFRKDH